jgi:hypothetical protein
MQEICTSFCEAELLKQSYIFFGFQGSENSLSLSRWYPTFRVFILRCLFIFDTPLLGFDRPTFLLIFVEFFIVASSRSLQ